MKIPDINIESVRILLGNIAVPTELLESSLKILIEQCPKESWGADCQEQLNNSLDRLHALSRELLEDDQEIASQEVDLQAFPLAIWAIRQGAVVETLGPVVHALAQLANQLIQPEILQRLYLLVDEIYNAIAPDIRADQGLQESGRPWRVLLLNRAIIATRSLQPDLMEAAFDSLVQYLPDDLNEFLKEGIRQLDIVGYPEPVQEVMKTYYTQYGMPATLH